MYLFLNPGSSVSKSPYLLHLQANEESEKMDEDSKIIEELREQNEYQKARILHLENALKQTTAGLEEVKKLNNSELQKSKEIIDDLNKKLANCMRTLDSKNVELLNLQTALGQYFAEIEAKVKSLSFRLTLDIFLLSRDLNFFLLYYCEHRDIWNVSWHL